MARAHVGRWLTALGLTVGLLAPLKAQQQGQLYISVLDAEGKPVKELAPEEITITADGQDAKVVKVEPFGKPTRLTLMIDNGNATARDLAGLRSAYKTLIEGMPEGVQMELITTAPQPRWLERATTDRAKLAQAIDRLASDSAAGAFFDALVEGGNRVEKDRKDKTEYFPIFLMLASDTGRSDAVLEWKYEKLQKQVSQHGITVHFVMYRAGSQAALGPQADVGTALTKMSGGRFDTINMMTRFTTLVPELAQQIAQSDLRQMNQFRVTYERPGKDSKGAQSVGARLRTSRSGLVPQISFDGHMPRATP